VPSYRASLQVLDVRPGHAPEEVMDAAVAGVALLCSVEGQQLDLVRGMPVIRVRFVVDAASQTAQDRAALTAGEALASAVAEVARHGAMQVTRRVKGRWYRVDPERIRLGPAEGVR